jgi:aminoglycoside phosphotransferase (APT) family kinase protein
MSHTQIALDADVMTSRLSDMARRTFRGVEGVEGLRRLSGGSSQETWAFATYGSIRRQLILRRGPDGVEHHRAVAAGLLKEAQLISRANDAGLPVPKIICVLSSEDGLGAGYVMDRLNGETIARKILRDADFVEVRQRLATQCGDVLARIHSLPVADLGLRQSTAAGELDHYYRKYIEQEDPHPVFELAFCWLREYLPPPVESALVHGDFRLGNLMVGADGLCGVLDWELAHFGDPMEDLAFICVPSWRFGNLDMPVGGFGRREELFGAYEAAGGTVNAARVRWWEVYGILKWGVVCGGMALTFRRGIDRSAERGIIGRRASETEIDLLRELTRSGGES